MKGSKPRPLILPTAPYKEKDKQPVIIERQALFVHFIAVTRSGRRYHPILKMGKWSLIELSDRSKVTKLGQKFEGASP